MQTDLARAIAASIEPGNGTTALSVSPEIRVTLQIDLRGVKHDLLPVPQIKGDYVACKSSFCELIEPARGSRH